MPQKISRRIQPLLALMIYYHKHLFRFPHAHDFLHKVARHVIAFNTRRVKLSCVRISSFVQRLLQLGFQRFQLNVNLLICRVALLNFFSTSVTSNALLRSHTLPSVSSI